MGDVAVERVASPALLHNPDCQFGGGGLLAGGGLKGAKRPMLSPNHLTVVVQLCVPASHKRGYRARHIAAVLLHDFTGQNCILRAILDHTRSRVILSHFGVIFGIVFGHLCGRFGALLTIFGAIFSGAMGIHKKVRPRMTFT